MKNIFNPYAHLVNLKNFLYDKKILNQIVSNIKIISIGNLTTGGSGKTPFTHFFVTEFLLNKKVLIVCKSYKATLKKPSQVDLKNDNAVAIYGDEACLLQKKLPQCVVWSGPSKSQTVKAALQQNSQYDIILIDDGFSHRKLFRHRDIVLVDASRTQSHYRLIPFGHMREQWSTLRRAHLVVLTKTEGVSKLDQQFFTDQISAYQKNIVSLQFKSHISSSNKKLFLVTGIGNPEKLKIHIQEQGFIIVQHLFYSDHFNFNSTEQQNILELTDQYPDLQLVMTEKDLVKITHPALLSKIVVIHLTLAMNSGDRKILYDQILL